MLAYYKSVARVYVSDSLTSAMPPPRATHNIRSSSPATSELPSGNEKLEAHVMFLARQNEALRAQLPSDSEDEETVGRKRKAK